MPQASQAIIVVSMMLLSACASPVPPSRITEYVPLDQPTGNLTMVAGRHNLQAALVVISDTRFSDGAATLPDQAMKQLGEDLKAEISRALPVSIQEVIYKEGAALKGRGAAAWSELAKESKSPYLALVVLSSTEEEHPIVLKLGGGSPRRAPGVRRDNWSLLEFALLDVKNGTVLLRTEGRGWATLDRPAAAVADPFYPVIFLRPHEPNRRIWPPADEGALTTLRLVCFQQAAKRLGTKLQNLWRVMLQEQASARGIN